MSLYSELVAAGVQIDSYRSDLQFPNTKQAQAILQNFPIEQKNAQCFISNLDGKPWIEVPFAYVPWWELRGMK